jgi:transposase-like protein
VEQGSYLILHIEEENMLTEEQKKKYLKNPCLCPYCGSEEIHTHSNIEAMEDGRAFQSVKCKDCNLTWADRYVLMDIEEDE